MTPLTVEELRNLYDRLHTMVNTFTKDVKEEHFDFETTNDLTREYRNLNKYLKQDKYYISLIRAMEQVDALNTQLKAREGVLTGE